MFAALRPLPGPASPPPHDVLPRRATTPVVTQDPATVWPRIQDELRRAVPASSYEIWLAPLRPLALDGDDVVLRVPTALHGWVAERFGRVLQTSVAAVLGPSAGVRLEPGDDPGRRSPTTAAAGWDAPRRTRRQPGRPARPRRAVGALGARRGRGARRRGDASAHAEHARRRAQPEVHLRPVRDRAGQPLRPRRRAGRRRAPGPGLQPALRLRPARRRQDPPPALDRQLRPVPRRRADRPLRHGRDVHERVRRRAAAGRHRRASRRSTARSACSSSTTSSSSRRRRGPRRSSSTPSTRSRRPAASSSLTSDRVPRDLDGVHDRLRERFEAGLVTDIEPPDRRPG